MKEFLSAGIFIFILSSCSSAPAVYNVNNEYIPTLQSGKNLSQEDVEKSILSAAYKRGWSPRVIKTGLIEARITVRSHRASIEIPYSDNRYSIIYKDSKELDYKNGTIHRNYNKWIMNLSNSIERELGVRAYNY